MTSEYKQHYKDRRALCTFCPSNPECERIRTAVHCGDCPTALVCATQSDLGRQNCAFVRNLWSELPCKKCILAASLLTQYPGNHGVFVLGVRQGHPATEETASTEIMAFVCPRCEEIHLTVNVEHTWAPLKSRTTTYVTVCGICGVNESLELTKFPH